MKRVLKWNVPVDDDRHPVGRGPVVHVDCQTGDPLLLQVWTEEHVDTSHPMDPLPQAQVYGTGHEFPNRGRAVGSVLAYDGSIVWHVVRFEQ